MNHTINRPKSKTDGHCYSKPERTENYGTGLLSGLFDEGTRLQANDSFLSLGIRHLSPPHRLVLTGTPIKNRLESIFWLLHWVAGAEKKPESGNLKTEEKNASTSGFKFQPSGFSSRFPYAATAEAREAFANEHLLLETAA